MSGLEVAGLVLGAFPIVLSMLEKYQDTAETFKVLQHIRKEHKKCRNSVTTCRLEFQQHLRQFLLPLFIHDDMIEALISDPGHALWKTASFEKEMRAHLPYAYDSYKDTMDAFHEAMNELQQLLQHQLVYEVCVVYLFLEAYKVLNVQRLGERPGNRNHRSIDQEKAARWVQAWGGKHQICHGQALTGEASQKPG